MLARTTTVILCLCTGLGPGCSKDSSWAEVLEHGVDRRVVHDAELCAAIEATRLPWRVRHKGTGIEMLLVPPGHYRRGAAPDDAEALADEHPAHEVTLTRPFYLGRYELTQAQWQAVMDKNPSAASHDPQAPVDSLIDAQIAAFLGRTGLRLPTEAEWEYACRAGASGARYGDLDETAWYEHNSVGGSHPVGLKQPNALGFHDMLGNVWERCADWYAEDEYERCRDGVTDPRGPAAGDVRVLHGGSWLSAARGLRASFRLSGPWAARRIDDDGLRVARDP